MTPKKGEPDNQNEDALERMNKALKKMLETPPETHKDFVERKRKPRAVKK